MGVKLNVTDEQKAKAYKRLINEEVGGIKLRETISAKKPKAEEKCKAIQDKFDQEEKTFQVERARRIAELLKQRKPQ